MVGEGHEGVTGKGAGCWDETKKGSGEGKGGMAESGRGTGRRKDLAAEGWGMVGGEVGLMERMYLRLLEKEDQEYADMLRR